MSQSHGPGVANELCVAQLSSFFEDRPLEARRRSSTANGRMSISVVASPVFSPFVDSSSYGAAFRDTHQRKLRQYIPARTGNSCAIFASSRVFPRNFPVVKCPARAG